MFELVIPYYFYSGVIAFMIALATANAIGGGTAFPICRRTEALFPSKVNQSGNP
jgi:hypothetical protein